MAILLASPDWDTIKIMGENIMAEKKKNDAASILAKIRQKMNKIDQSNYDDDILLDDNDNIQSISSAEDKIENFKPTDSALNNILETKPTTKNEKAPINNNPEFEDEDIFQGATLDDEFVVPQNDKNKKDIFDDEDLKFDMDLEEDKEEIKPDTKQEENDFDDLDNLDLDDLEEPDDEKENKIIEGEVSEIEEPTTPSKPEILSNNQEEEFDELDDLLEDSEESSTSIKSDNNIENGSEEQDDDLDLDFLEEEQDEENRKPIENSTSDEVDLDELDDLEDLSEIDEESTNQISSSETPSVTNFSTKQNEDDDLFEEETQHDELEQDDIEDEQEEDIFEEESEDEEKNDKKENNHSQQFYQQKSSPNMISKKAMDEAQQSIKKLIQAVPKKQEMLFERSPAFRSGETIEDMVMSILRPKLEQWFNENLPIMVEKIVREEIKKIVPKDED